MHVKVFFLTTTSLSSTKVWIWGLGFVGFGFFPGFLAPAVIITATKRKRSTKPLCPWEEDHSGYLFYAWKNVASPSWRVSLMCVLSPLINSIQSKHWQLRLHTQFPPVTWVSGPASAECCRRHMALLWKLASSMSIQELCTRPINDGSCASVLDKDEGVDIAMCN